MKNLFIIKRILQDKTISDEAFAVWCGLRNIMRQDITEYFVSFNMIAHSVFNRVPSRYELDDIKNGYKELVEKEYIKELIEFGKSERVVDLSALYFEAGQEFFADLSMEEMHKIMNLDCGRISKCKLLRYFTCHVGSFNHSADMCSYKGKIGGMSLDYFTELIPITKPTAIAFNEILEKNELLFIIRHKDFFQFTNWNMMSEIREIPNTYSRWKDREIAKHYAESVNGYKYFEDKNGTKSAAANKKRGLAQKLKYFKDGREYDYDTVKELYAYAKEKNKKLKKEYDANVKNGINKEPNYIDMDIFDDCLLDIDKEYWGEEI